MRFRVPVIVAAVLLAGTLPAHAQLRGHGGPVRALALSADGATALSGSFDGSAILWSLPRDAAAQVLRFHDDAVNAVALRSMLNRSQSYATASPSVSRIV